MNAEDDSSSHSVGITIQAPASIVCRSYHLILLIRIFILLRELIPSFVVMPPRSARRAAERAMDDGGRTSHTMTSVTHVHRISTM
jgi:hypothetical protein